MYIALSVDNPAVYTTTKMTGLTKSDAVRGASEVRKRTLGASARL
jgi:hypothetical protein